MSQKKFNPEIADMALKLVGKACAIRRNELKIFQSELAEMSGLTQRQISNFETGEQNLTLKSFFAVLGCLDMHIDLTEKNPDNLTGFSYRGFN